LKPIRNANVISYVKSLIPVSLKFTIIVLFFFISVQARDISPFVQIPFELKSGYLVFSVPIEPSGSLSFLFDTGCQMTTIRKDVLAIANWEHDITFLLGTRKLKIEDLRVLGYAVGVG